MSTYVRSRLQVNSSLSSVNDLVLELQEILEKTDHQMQPPLS